MNKIDDLIAKLCPNGVEYKAIGEIGTLVRGNGMPKSDFEETGVGCIHYGQIYTYYGIWTAETISFIAKEKADKLAKVDPGDIIITNTSENIDDVCKAVAWLGDCQIVTGGHATVLKHDQDSKYISYYLKTPTFFTEKKRYATGTKVIDVSAKNLGKIKIPVPPLEIQREIVKVLDTFTKLEAELEAELKLRRKQYQYHIDDLLNFENDIPNLKLSEIFEFKNGLNKGKEFFGKGNFIVKYTDVYKNNFLFKSSLSDRVEVTENEKNNVSAKKGDVFFTRTSETREEIGFASVLLEDIEGCVFSGFLIRGRQKQERLLPKYCSYCFKSKKVREQIIKNCIFTTRASLSGANLGLVKIPVPSLEEQTRIVAILDKFDALVNDLSSGLPAEIAARRKQYEYYRNRLLTFKEAQ